MTKGAQLWPGERMRAFFLAHIERQTSLDSEAAGKLADALTKAVNRMLVWEEPSAAAAQPEAAAQPTKPQIAKCEPEVSDEPSPEAFNPYIFSAMVLLAKKGPDALLQRLAEIKSVAHLRAFAEAQHLSLEPALKRGEDIRQAIVAATERRLADRKAAAS